MDDKEDDDTVEGVQFRAGGGRGSAVDLPPGRYEAGEVIGRGGMGEVVAARDRVLGRTVALKRMNDGARKNEKMRARFVREARIQAILEHPAIVPVYDFVEGPEGAYLTMKRIGGSSLAEVIARLRKGETAGDWNLRRLLTAFSQLCSALQSAHEQGVVHRDLKPSNVMLGRHGEVYVIDWGIAKVEGGDDALPDAVVASGDGTETIDLLGTPGYMAPEQINFDSVGPPSDVFALGAILFEIVTLDRLFRGDHQSRLVASMRGVDPLAWTGEAPWDVAPELLSLVAEATRVSPGERIGSAELLRDAVERYLDGERDSDVRARAAAQHLDDARRLCLRVEAGEEGRRSDAMRAVGRALAFDPGSRAARETLVTLMTAPTGAMPLEVMRRSEQRDDARLRVSMRLLPIVFACFLAFVPFALWSGVRAPGWLAALAVSSTLLIGLSFVLPRLERVRLGLVIAVMLACAVLIATTSALAGPLICVPMITAAMMPNAALLRDIKWTPFIIGLLPVAAPLALEAAGVLPPSYAFSDGVMHVLPTLFEHAAAPTLGMLAAAFILTLGTSTIQYRRIRLALIEAEQRLLWQTYQLEQLVAE